LAIRARSVSEGGGVLRLRFRLVSQPYKPEAQAKDGSFPSLTLRARIGALNAKHARRLDQPERPATAGAVRGGHLPGERPGRPEAKQDKLGGAPAPPAERPDRHRGGEPLAAREPPARPAPAARGPLPQAARGTAARGTGARGAGGTRGLP